MTRNSASRVLILGGGYAGMLAAARIARRGPAQVTLIDQRASFVQRIRMHEALTGTSVPGLAYGPSLARRGVRFLQARLDGIDAARQEVSVTAAEGGVQRLGYDALLIALGSGTTAGVPGAGEHALRLNDPVVVTRSTSQLQRLAATGGQALVIGGGLTAIETAAELGARLPGLRVTLATAGALGSDYSTAAAQYLRVSLQRLGVELIEGVRISALEPGQAHLADGGSLRYDCAVWAGGFAAPRLLREVGFAVDAQGRAVVTSTLQVPGNPTLFVAGDSAAAGDAGRAIRMGCVSAAPMGAHAGENIAAALAGAPLRPFRFGFFMRCVSLGRRDALVQSTDGNDRPLDRMLTGRSAAVVKELVCRAALESVRGELHTGLPLTVWPGGGRWWDTSMVSV
jgi:NADH:ubiquinone reductase (H+-translocating)